MCFEFIKAAKRLLSNIRVQVAHWTEFKDKVIMSAGMLHIDELHNMFAVQFLDQIEFIFEHLSETWVQVHPRLLDSLDGEFYFPFFVGAAPFSHLVSIKCILPFEDLS